MNSIAPPPIERVLVVPSNREDHLRRFFEAWDQTGRDDWDHSIVVFDGPQAPEIPGADQVVCWPDITADLYKDAWIISRGDSAIRSYGFLLAYRMGASLIGTLDDDCMPAGNDFFREHYRSLHERTRWTPSAINITPRGMPYQNRGTLKDVMISIGLWSNYADLDAPHSLVNNPVREFFQPSPESNRVIPFGQYVPMCGMNLAFRREAIPLMYFPLMGKDQPFSRFDDIWAGIIAKKICDHLGWHMVVGGPTVNHERASDPFVNLQKEAAGIGENETFWSLIDDIQLTESDAMGCLRQLAAGLGQTNNSVYTSTLAHALVVWARLLEARHTT